MKIYRYLLPILLATAVACEHADPEPGNAGNGNTETPGDDLLGGGDVDMSEWPDYTKPEMSASGPSVVVYTQNKSTVNGKPFIPMAIYGVNQGDMADVAGYGFNLIQSYQVTPDDMDNIRNWLDEAQQHGLMGCVNLDGAELDAAKVEEEIKTMPNYFSDYDTTVHFISQEELDKNHSGIPHGGFVLRSGKTGWEGEHSHLIEYSLKLDSNPEFTSSVLVAYARAAYLLYKEGQSGCKTVFDIAPAYLSSKSGEELRASML